MIKGAVLTKETEGKRDDAAMTLKECVTVAAEATSAQVEKARLALVATLCDFCKELSAIPPSRQAEELLAKDIFTAFNKRSAISAQDFIKRASVHAAAFAHRIGTTVKHDLGLASESSENTLALLPDQVSLYLLLEAHGMNEWISVPGLSSMLSANRIRLAEFQIRHALDKRVNEVRDSTWWLVSVSFSGGEDSDSEQDDEGTKENERFSQENRETAIFRVSDPEDRVQYAMELVLSDDKLELDALRQMPLPGLSGVGGMCTFFAFGYCDFEKAFENSLHNAMTNMCRQSTRAPTRVPRNRPARVQASLSH